MVEEGGVIESVFLIVNTDDLRNDTLFYTLNEKTPSFFRYSPIFALSLQLDLERRNPFYQ